MKSVLGVEQKGMAKGVESKKRDGASRSGYKGALELASYLRPYRSSFVPAMVALFFTAGLSFAFPYYMAQLLGEESVVDAANKGTLDFPNITSQIDRVALTLGLVLFVQATIAFFRIRLFTKAGESAIADMRKDLYSRLIRLPMAYFGEHRVGELSSRIASDLTLIRETFLTTIPQFVRHSVMLVGGLIFLFATSLKLALFMLACLPVVVLLVAFFGRKVRGFSRAAQDELADSQVVVEETLQAVTSVKAFHNEGYETRRYGDRLKRFLDVTMHGASVRAAFVAFIIFILMGTITLVVWYGVKMLEGGEINQQELMRFILFGIFVGASMGSLPEVISQLQKAVGATDSVREILAHEEEGLEHSLEDQENENKEQKPLRGEIEMEGVKFAYPSRPDFAVLDGVEFKASSGERIALVGGSGQGKSTIANLRLQFYMPEAGLVRFDGRPASEYSLKFLRSQMALVPQEVILFGGTIRENIAYGRPGATAEEIETAAQRAQADAFIREFPEGYDTLVGDRGQKISGGQKQRIAIARALLADPAILILDEATSALDSESERQVQLAMDELMKGRTSVIVAHRLSTIRDADRILVLQGGRVAEAGTHDELIGLPDGLYRMYSRLQGASP